MSDHKTTDTARLDWLERNGRSLCQDIAGTWFVTGDPDLAAGMSGPPISRQMTPRAAIDAAISMGTDLL